MTSEYLEIGVDQAAGKDETVINVEGGCVKCHRSWPQATFHQLAVKIPELGGQMDRSEIICDYCLASEGREGQIAEAIDEAQSGKPVAQQITREVVVSGVESRSNVIGWRYETCRGVALLFTDLTVEFKGSKFYRYSQVPTAVCEAWIAAMSIGSVFAEQIRNSYPCEKIK